MKHLKQLSIYSGSDFYRMTCEFVFHDVIMKNYCIPNIVFFSIKRRKVVCE